MSSARLGASRHWIVTALFALLLFGSGMAYLAGVPAVREGLAHLGFPPYVRFILGTAKLLGVAALLQPRWPVLREWAYAGFTINLIRASHVFTGDPWTVVAVPLSLLGLLAVSYGLWRRGARGSLGSIWEGARPAEHAVRP